MDDKKFYTERLLENDNYKVFLPDTPHIKRSDISSEGFNTQYVNQTLKDDYSEIYESIQKESFYISDNEKYFYFYEIYDETDDKIIGFSTFSIYNKTALLLNQIYVLPEYRGQRHFVRVYNYFSQLLPESEIYVKNPNHVIIKNIKDLNYCHIIDNRLLISNILFVTDQVSFEDALKYTNKTLEDNGEMAPYHTESNLYDLELDAVIKLSPNNKIYMGHEDLLKVERSTISMVRDEDEKNYDILIKRKEDPWIQKGNYFKKISKLLKKEKIVINR